MLFRSKALKEDIENYNGINILFQQDDDEVFVKASTGGRELGHVLFVNDGEYLIPQDLEVEERFRGQGIAQTMYDFVKSKGYRIRRSGQQTDAGAGFWAKHRPEQNVWEEKKLDPDIYGEMLPFDTAKSIIQNVVRSVDPQAKLKITQSPEGYYTVEGEKIGLDFGITADAGEINANLVNAFSSYKGAGVVTEILRQCFKAMADLYGQPTDFVISAHQDRGHGVWQAIAKKLGAKWGGSIYENFADGKVKGKSRPGRVKRAGASCAGSVTDLRAKAKKYGGERGKMYHWCANMKGGRK